MRILVLIAFAFAAASAAPVPAAVAATPSRWVVVLSASNAYDKDVAILSSSHCTSSALDIRGGFSIIPAGDGICFKCTLFVKTLKCGQVLALALSFLFQQDCRRLLGTEGPKHCMPNQ